MRQAEGGTMTDGKDWLDAIEENCRLSEEAYGRILWHITHTDIIRLIAEVRRLRAEIDSTHGPMDRNLKWQVRDAKTAHASILKDRNRVIEQNVALRAENERLRWFEANFRCMVGCGCCSSCIACDTDDEEQHAPDCEYLAHKERKNGQF
jgi:hypothetical protein